ARRDALAALGQLCDGGDQLLVAAPGQMVERGGEQRGARLEVMQVGASRDPGALRHARGRRPLVALLHEARDGRVEQREPGRLAALGLRTALGVGGGRHGLPSYTYVQL